MTPDRHTTQATGLADHRLGPLSAPRTGHHDIRAVHPSRSVTERWRAVLAASAGFLHRRPPLWAEALVIVWLLWIYDAISNLSPLRVDAALGHAASILHVEASLHLNLEPSLNAIVSAHHWLALSVADYYDNAHFVVTFAVLAWLWAARPGHYRRWRCVLVVSNLIGFAVFWAYPMAPPRMLPGFVDTVAASHAIGSWHSGGLAADANQYAAMPSLHVAWAAWSALAVWATSRRRVVRTVAAIYPLLTAFAVIATANHLLVDSAAGLATAGAATSIEPALARTWRSVRRSGAVVLAARVVGTSPPRPGRTTPSASPSSRPRRSRQ